MDEPATTFATKQLADKHDALAPDGSEIRVLASTSRGSMAHGTLPPGGVSLAVTHRTVEELWYVVEGRGEVWRKQGAREEAIAVGPGTALSIPVGTHFQFRATGPTPLRFVMVTMPPWPGEHEAVRVADHWPTDDGNPPEIRSR
jgi:mannose-6-phosphate isomerase-like protein (cupin superfamily)